jgi:predicted transcriptional regulator
MDVLRELPEKRNYSTVRAQLRVLEAKGHATHETQNLPFVYAPAIPREVARRAALRHVIEVFFDGSAENLLVALMIEDRK